MTYLFIYIAIAFSFALYLNSLPNWDNEYSALWSTVVSVFLGVVWPLSLAFIIWTMFFRED